MWTALFVLWSIGQTEEAIQLLKTTIEEELHCQVEVVDATNGNAMRNHRSIIDVIRAFGFTSLPIITYNGEIASIGNAPPNEAVSAIKEKMNTNKEE